MAKRKKNHGKRTDYHENSIFTTSRNYDPLAQPDILRVSIADGAIITDNRAKFYATTRVMMEAAGNREYYEFKAQKEERLRNFEEQRRARDERERQRQEERAA